MADEAMETAKKRVAEDAKLRERSAAEYAERTKGKPTPTQEENDLAASGAHIIEHEDDGSGPDPNDPRHQTRNVEAKPASGPARYPTRSATASRSE